MKVKLLFIVKIAIVFTPIIWISLYSRNNMLAYVDEEAPYYIWNRDVCNTMQSKHYTTVILGDSVANVSYIPEALSDTVINLALGGITPAESYYIMQDWLDNNPHPSDVFISFSDNHMSSSDCFWLRTMYSHRLKPRQSWEILCNAINYKDSSIATETCLYDYVSYVLYLPNKYFTSLKNAKLNQRYYDNLAAYNMDDIHKGRYLIRQKSAKVSDIMSFDDYKVSDLYDHYYKMLIELCLSNDIRVHLIKLPLPSGTILSKEYNEHYNAYYTTVKEAYPEVIIECPRENYDIEYFADQVHLNSYGALKFSLELKQLYPYAFGNEISDDQKKAIKTDIIDSLSVENIYEWCKLAGYDICAYSNQECGAVGDIEVNWSDDDDGLRLEIRDPSNNSWVCDKVFDIINGKKFELVETKCE